MSKTVFLSYSSGYDFLKDPFIRLMQALGFESVYAFDHPDQDRVTDRIKERLKASDAVVVLYGPHDRPAEGQRNFPGADFPRDEANLALGMGKPVALIVHQGTQLPDLLQQSQTAARFDFWDAISFRTNIHHIIKHLLDLKRRVDLPPGAHPYLFRKLEFKFQIESPKEVKVIMYNHAVVRQPQSETRFHHCVNVAGDTSIDVALPRPVALTYEAEAVLGAESHSISLEWGKCTDHEIEYWVKVLPPLAAGEEFGYWRSFTLPNWFPLTRAEISHRAAKSGFPSLYGGSFYGDSCEVTSELDSFTWSFRFPKSFRLQSYRTLVVDHYTRGEYKSESNRCLELVQWKPFPDQGDNVLELTVPRPLINHDYFLLYEPKN